MAVTQSSHHRCGVILFMAEAAPHATQSRGGGVALAHWVRGLVCRGGLNGPPIPIEVRVSPLNFIQHVMLCSGSACHSTGYTRPRLGGGGGGNVPKGHRCAPQPSDHPGNAREERTRLASDWSVDRVGRPSHGPRAKIGNTTPAQGGPACRAGCHKKAPRWVVDSGGRRGKPTARRPTGAPMNRVGRLEPFFMQLWQGLCFSTLRWCCQLKCA